MAWHRSVDSIIRSCRGLYPATSQFDCVDRGGCDLIHAQHVANTLGDYFDRGKCVSLLKILDLILVCDCYLHCRIRALRACR